MSPAFWKNSPLHKAAWVHQEGSRSGQIQSQGAVGETIGRDDFQVGIRKQDQSRLKGVGSPSDVLPRCTGHTNYGATICSNRRCNALETLELPYAEGSPVAPIEKDQGVPFHFRKRPNPPLGIAH